MPGQSFCPLRAEGNAGGVTRHMLSVIGRCSPFAPHPRWTAKAFLVVAQHLKIAGTQDADIRPDNIAQAAFYLYCEQARAVQHWLNCASC